MVHITLSFLYHFFYLLSFSLPKVVLSVLRKRNVVVEWLELLDYGAESPRKVMSSRLGFAMQQLENSVNPAVNGYLFRIREG